MSEDDTALETVKSVARNGPIPSLEDRYEYWSALCMRILFTTDCHLILAGESEYGAFELKYLRDGTSCKIQIDTYVVRCTKFQFLEMHVLPLIRDYPDIRAVLISANPIESDLLPEAFKIGKCHCYNVGDMQNS